MLILLNGLMNRKDWLSRCLWQIHTSQNICHFTKIVNRLSPGLWQRLFAQHLLLQLMLSTVKSLIVLILICNNFQFSLFFDQYFGLSVQFSLLFLHVSAEHLHSCPLLHRQYQDFMEKYVYSDDPFTPSIEYLQSQILYYFPSNAHKILISHL